jgi:hypothetical protein
LQLLHELDRTLTIATQDSNSTGKEQERPLAESVLPIKARSTADELAGAELKPLKMALSWQAQNGISILS